MTRYLQRYCVSLDSRIVSKVYVNLCLSICAHFRLYIEAEEVLFLTGMIRGGVRVLCHMCCMLLCGGAYCCSKLRSSNFFASYEITNTNSNQPTLW